MKVNKSKTFKNKLKISVVIGVRNRDYHLKHCLFSLLHQSLARDEYEVIVVNYGGGNSTQALVHSFGELNARYIFSEETG